MEGLELNSVEITVKRRIWEKQDMEINQDMIKTGYEINNGLNNVNITHSILQSHRYNKIVILLSIKTIFLHNSVQTIQPEPNELLSATLNMSFLKNWLPFIHKLIHGYTSITLCRINSWLICLFLTCNSSCKKCNGILSSKTWQEPKY